jgi:hypothetical protein
LAVAEALEDVRLTGFCEWVVAVEAHVLSRPSFHALVHDTECRVLVGRYLSRCWLVLDGVLNCLQKLAEPGKKQNIGTRKEEMVV